MIMKCGEKCEIWKNIPGISTHEVSSLGNIRSRDRVSVVTASGLGGRTGTVVYTRKLKGRLLSKHKTKHYLQVSINDHDYLIHRLVA